MAGKPKVFQYSFANTSKVMNDVFKALADPTRREILLMLANETASIGHVVEKFEMSRPAVAKHLKILQNANLLGIEADDEDGRQRNCYIQLEALNEVEEYIAKLEAFWKQRLDGLGTYLSKKHSQ